MKNRRIKFWTFLTVLLYSFWMVVPVSAHAILLRSNPASNEVLTLSPVQVELFFSEPLEESLSSISVIDSNGVIVDAGDVRVDPSDLTRLTVSLRSLNEGVYTVTWKVVSSLDGHQTVGSYPFGVGAAATDAVKSVQKSSSVRLPFSSLLAKIVMLASLALLVAQRLFTVLIWQPALKSHQETIARPPVWHTLYRSAMVGLLVSIAIGILSQAGQTTGHELSLPWDRTVANVLVESRLGLIWLMRLAAALLLIWLANDRNLPIREWLGFALALVLLLTISLTSHAATENAPLLPVIDDWVHLIGMAFWLGGVVYLYTGIRWLQQIDEPLRTELTSLLTRQFSINAIVAVGLIGITGFYSAVLRVATWSGLWNTLYGHVLLIKQGFVGGLLVIAAINFLVISPRLNRARLAGSDNAAVVQTFGRLLIIELTLAGLLLASVGFLTYIPPAKTIIPVTDFNAKQQADDLLVKININPARVGENVFMLVMDTPDGKSLRSAREVLLRFTPSRPNVPPSELQLIGDGTGMFMAKGSNLSFPDTWQVQAVVRRQDKFDVFANFDLVLEAAGTADKSAAARQAGGWILTIGLCVALIAFSANADRRVRWGLGLPLAMMTIASGILILMRPPVNASSQANPIPANSESVTAGAALFAENCAPCHGVSGKGDGPVGVTMNPRPADLTQHAIPGVHTDAQLYEWITNGFPGTRMLAFGATLSDTDRWNIVNYVRTLAP